MDEETTAALARAIGQALPLDLFNSHANRAVPTGEAL